MPSVSLRWSLLVVSALAAGASFAACSSTKATDRTDAGDKDAGVDADDDGSADVATGPADVAVYPDAPSQHAPDGCALPGAACLEGTTCCSAYCADSGCALMPVMQ